MADFKLIIFRFTQSALLMVLLSNAVAQGPAWEWARTMNTNDDEHVNDVVADRSTNDVYIVGQWERDLNAVFPVGANPSSDFTNPYGDKDGFVAKYDSAGNFIWAFKLGGPNDDITESIAIDPDGNIYITGYFGSGTSYFSGTSPHTAPSTLDNSSGEDFYIAKYTSSGEFQWVKRSETNLGDLAGLDLYATSSAVFATGRADAQATFGVLSMSNIPNQDDIFLIKYDLDGTEQWVAQCGSNSDDLVFGVIADDSSVYFTGSFDGSSLNLRDAIGGTVSSLNNVNNGTHEIVIACYDVDGYNRWSQSISSPEEDEAFDITMDTDSLYITGGFSGPATFPGYAGNPVSTTSNMDIFFSSHAKTNGNTGWVSTLPCTDPGNEQGRSIDTDGKGILYMSGDFKQDLFFPDAVSLTAVGDEDVFEASYTTDGTFRWAVSAGSTGEEDGYGVSSGSEGTVYIGGLYSDMMTLGPLTLPDDAQDNGYLAKLSESSPPENDNPCSAILLPVGDTCNATLYDNNLATDSGIPDPGCAEYAGGDVWFKAVIPPSGNLFIGTNASTDDTYPPTNGWMYRIGLAVYSGPCGTLNFEGCYSYNSAYHYRASSVFLFDENPGDTAWIRIWEQMGNDFGNFSICTYDPGHYPAWKIPESLCEEDGLIDLDTTIRGSITGFVDQVVDFSGIPDPADVVGAQDITSAEMFEDGDWIKLDLTDTIPPGEIYQIYFHSNNSLPGVTQMTVWESVDNVTYYPHSFKPETDGDIVTSHFIIAEHPTRYLLIENDNAGGGGFALDGIKYYFRGTRGGTWSGPGVTGSLFDPSGLSGLVPITYSVGGSTTFMDSTNIINILKSEGGILTPDTTVCFDNDELILKLNVSRGDILKWESSEDSFSTTTSIPSNDSVLSVSNRTQTTQYRVIVQDGSCQPDTSNSITITVYPQSTAHLSGDTTICNGSTATMTVDFTGVSPWNLEYENDIDTILITGIVDNPYNFSANPSLTTTYSIVAMVDGNGCSGMTSGSANVEPVSIAANPGEDSALCGLTFQFNAIPGIGTGIWTQTSGPGTSFFTPSAEFPDAEVAVDAYGAYKFTWTETNGPCIDSATIAVVFNEQPNANVTVGGDNCGLSFQLEAIPSVGIGEWSIISGPGTADFVSGVNSAVTTVSVNDYGSYGFIWKETNGNCSDNITAYVNFFDKIIVDAGTDEEVCSQEYVLNATPGKGSGYWSKISGPGKVSFSPSDTAISVTVSVDEYGSYEFQWFEAIGDCNGSDNVEIRFHEQPTADAGSDQVLDYVFSTYLDAGITEFGTGNWELVKGTGQVHDENDPVSEVTGLSLGKNEFTWTIETGVCEDVSDKVVITVNDLLTPTVITPNNDGYNDYLVFSGTDELNDNEIIIYSRWGTEVYRSKDYQNDWDGRDHNNRELPLDTYYYILQLSSGRLIKGFVEIRR